MAVALAELTRPLFGGIVAPPWPGRADCRHLTVGEMRLRSDPAPVARLTQGTHGYSWLDPASSLSWGLAGCELACSRAAPSADSPRAVWLFTAPRLMPIAAAISPSDRPA